MSTDNIDNINVQLAETGISDPPTVSEVDAEPQPDPCLPVYDGDRDPTTGRVMPGNKLAVGNGIGRKIRKFRAELFASVNKADFREVAAKLLREAKAGRKWAVTLLLNYLCGIPQDATQDRIAILERVLLYQGELEE
ncbi:MAG: hypothetical protein ABSG67_08450 [Thermoguttaceae bacterium]|jgi:hypothetical protein